MFIIYNRKLKPTGNFNAHLYRMYVVITPNWENQCVVCLKKNAMGRCAFRKSQKSVQNCANQHRTLCAINNFFRLNIRCFLWF